MSAFVRAICFCKKKQKTLAYNCPFNPQIVNVFIRAVWNSFFFYEKILHIQKAQKSTKSSKSTNTQPSKSIKYYKQTDGTVVALNQ